MDSKQEMGEKFDEHIFTRAFKLSCELGNMQAENTLLKRELALLRKVAEAAAGVVKQRGFTEALPEDWLLLVAHNEYEAWKEEAHD